MDWDDEKYDREELHDHLGELEILRDHSVEDLLVRTTQNTRTGNEFGFKPTEIALGLTSASKTCFYSGFKRMVDRKGLSVLSGEETPSSFWICFQEEVEFSCARSKHQI
ncbi:hypothetical protein PHLCEN_2v11766 [Hermanssonia centrifuga]|uniref:Uncharacterized protein n=1 Tax=Hermanssonia centrifuga TaxID=98765 RepID=A0A2R6NJ19_9APHY|nr:hypothetical protein PHLCEN_2v11766 [Hermanssonia centrifuga]